MLKSHVSKGLKTHNSLPALFSRGGKHQIIRFHLLFSGRYFQYLFGMEPFIWR